MLLTGPIAAVLPLLVEEEFEGSVRTLAMLSALLAVGAAGTAICFGRTIRPRRRGPLIYGCWAVAALAVAALGLPLPVAAAGFAALILGAAEAGVVLAWLSTLQELVPRERLGRVASIEALGSLALAPVGNALAGVVADHFGAALVFVAGGVIGAAVIALGFLHAVIRALD